MLITRKHSYKYSILMYNFNNYELIYDPIEIDPYCEYIYVTDDLTLKSNVWKLIIDTDLNKFTRFDKCYAVRYNLFKYCTTPICIYMDASIKIFKSLNWLYTKFMDSQADIGLNIHPKRNNFIDEYNAWLDRYKNDYDSYSNIDNGITLQTISNEKDRVLNFMKSNNYDFNYKGLYQGTMRICKNTELNYNIDSLVLTHQQKLGVNNHCARITQTIYSYILNKYFNNINVFPFDETYFYNRHAWRYNHKHIPLTVINHNNDNSNFIDPYVFNKPVYVNSFKNIDVNKNT